MERFQRDQLINFGILVLLGVVWGFSFFLMKRGLVAFSAVQVGAMRIFFAFLSFLPLVIYVGFKFPRKMVTVLIVSALLGSGIPPFLFTTAQLKIDSSVTGILNALTPFWTLIMGIFMFGIKLRINQLIGVLLGMAGTVLIILFKSDGSFEFNFGYALLIVLATLSYGTNANIIKSWLHKVHPIQIALFTFAFLGPFAGGYLFTTDFVHILKTDPYAWYSLTYVALLSVFGTSYALIVFNYLAHRTSALYASLVTYIIPIVAVLIGLADGEHLGYVHVIGMAMILTGIYLATRKKKTVAPVAE